LQRLWATLRVLITLFIGCILLIANFSYEWYSDEACVLTQYKAYVFPVGIEQEIQARVGLHIGLRGFNVTLKEMSLEECLGNDDAGDYVRPFPGEEINYNEQFYWADPWAQGRLGFGRFAGRVSREFREAQREGKPYPILWIAEYFTLDGEQIRWGRKFRQAGWYTHQCMWLAFALYLVTILLYVFVIRLGAYFTMLTGSIMILACFAFGVIILNDPKMKIPFSNPVDHTVFVDPQFGWSWYLTLFTGIGTLVLGLVVLLMDFFLPRKIAVVFHHSVVEEDEFFAQDEDEVEEVGKGEGFGEKLGGRTRATRRGGAARGGTTRRGISRYRNTERKPRSTVRSTGGGSQRRVEEGGIPLTEIQTET
jgi:hypothetical protein